MAAFPPGWRDRLDEFLAAWTSDERIPGASVAVVDDGAVVHAAGYGARDLATNAPATPETAYGVASVTKSLTALAVLQQVARTGLALSDPVTDHLDGVYADLDEPPTVHELLSHTSGLPSDGASVVLLARLTGVDDVPVPLSSTADLRRHVAGAVADRTSGDRFLYYNTGYTLLGHLVASVDGRPVPRYVGEEILAPLGMDRSTVAPDPEVLADRDDVATPYRRADGQRRPTRFPTKGVGAAGGLVAPVTDLASYLAYQSKTGAPEPGPEPVARDLLARAHEGHATRSTYLDGTRRRYGYGWTRRPFRGDTLIDHGGSLAVSTAYVGFLADAGVGIALACNDSPDVHPQQVGPGALALLDGGEPTETRALGLRAAADRVAGEYASHREIARATVEADGATIRLDLETALGTESIAARPASSDPDDLTYHAVGDDGARVPLEFVPGDDGLDLFYRRWRLRGTD
jgi:CubicO group peptidase (beta-lactamase class C family)